MGSDKFFEMLPELLHAFCERMDDFLGLKGEEELKKKYPKLPFIFFEYPK